MIFLYKRKHEVSTQGPLTSQPFFYKIIMTSFKVSNIILIFYIKLSYERECYIIL